MENVNRFIRYAKIDTQADDTSGLTPSTEKQKNLSVLLVKELLELGLEDAMMDEYGNVYAHLKGDSNLTIGFNAHIDTALEVTDTNVNPKIINDYDGKDIELGNSYTLKVSDFPNMKSHIGHDLVTTDGTTLLGADDKAGIAIIMSMLAYLVAHPEIKHHNIAVAFTVDEEIGEGSLHFNYERMGADFAYTCDGSSIDCIDYENFNALGVDINIKGVSVHPGEGKNALINSILVANEFINSLPKGETPFEAGYDDGYWHINDINGSVDETNISMILRAFSEDEIERRRQDIITAADEVRTMFPKAEIKANIREQYTNMRKYVEERKEVLEFAENALKKNGLTPRHTKIRGGTDGASFSKHGLITPNLGTGSYNHHGRYEFLDIQEFEAMIKIITDIVAK